MSDVLPPPPPRMRGDGGCWKVGVISCAVGCGLAVLLVVVLAVAFAPRLKQFVGQATEMAKDMARCQQDMREVYQAIEDFRTEKGKYPDRLEQLVPKYLRNEGELRFSGNPSGPKFGYRPPSGGTQPEDVLLEYKLDLTVPGGAKTSIPMRMRADGKFIDPQGNIQQDIVLPEGAGGIPSGGAVERPATGRSPAPDSGGGR
jgi:type II secretory pathway pseudopilin PulG